MPIVFRKIHSKIVCPLLPPLHSDLGWSLVMTGGVNYDGVEKLPNSTSHPMRGVITGKRIDTGKRLKSLDPLNP